MAERLLAQLPGERKINGEMVLHDRHLRSLLKRVFHKDGHLEIEQEEVLEDGLKEPLKCLEEMVDQAEAEDKDAILVARGSNTFVMTGRWIADHKRWVEAGAVVAALGAATTVGVVAALVTKGVILRKHPRESDKDKK